MISALSTVAFTILDIRETTVNLFERTPDWKWWTLGSFILFLIFIIWWIGGLESKIHQIKNALPNICTELVVNDRRFDLTVRNIGGKGGLFTASGKVVVGKPESGLYVMCWEGSDGKCQLNGGGGMASIFVAEKAPFTIFQGMESTIYEGELSLKRIGTLGVQSFPVHTYTQQPVVVDNKEGNEIIGENKCVLEITITSDPPLLEAFGTHIYTLEIDPVNRDRLLFTEVSTSHKEDYQTE